ncbi:putative ribonuclease H-like domain-containing protein [Tanacetum coccineum]
MESQSKTTQIVSALKLPILKTGDYDLWSIRIEKYLTHTNYALWEVIVNVDAPTVALASAEGPIHSKTAEQKLARKNELKANNTMLLAIPDEHLLNQLEIHGEVISQEDAYLKLLRSLPLAWNNIALIMRNKSNLDTLSMDDLYNNLKIDNDDLEEMDLKWQVAMLTMKVKRFLKKIGRNLNFNGKEIVDFDKTKAEEGITNFALMDYTSQGSSSLSSSDSEVHTCSKDCLKSYETLQKQYDQQREALKKSNLEIIDLKNQLEETLKEKDDLKLKLEKFEDSSKNLTKLINSQISAKDKAGLGYNSQINENEVVYSVFNSRESDVDDSLINDRFKIGEGVNMQFPIPTWETLCHLRPKLILCRDTNSDNDSVFRPKSDQTKPKFTKINFVKSDEKVKSINKENTHRQVEYPRKKKHVLKNKGRVTGQREIKPVWNNAQRVNHQNKLTHPHPKRNFVPTAVSTKSGQVPVNAAKQNSRRAAASISTARPVNTAAPKSKVNDTLPKIYSYFKAHSPVRRDFNQKSAAKTNNFNKKVKTTRVNNVTTAGPKAVVSAAVGNGENAVKSLACWIWRPTRNVIDHTSKDSGSYMLKRFDYGNPQYTLQDQGIFTSGCSRHITGNKSFLTDYQEVDGGFVAFIGSPKGGKITGKRRLGHINFKTMNKLVRGNLVRGLPSKLFENDHTCVACQKGKQHKASCKTKLVSSISQPLQMLHMDLFGPTSVRSINHKTYCLVVTDDYSRFSWVFFLATKDETSGILKTFITGIENQINHKVKIIRCDNGTEFKNNDMNQFCGMKGIKREFSVARTPQQNGVAERKNRTLIEAARTMLADSLLPTTFWAEAVSTACYVQNRVLVTKPHNKTPYELLHGRPPSISFMRPFGCPVTILNTLDPLGKFDGKADEGFFVGYSINSKAFRVFNTRTRNESRVTAGNQTNKNVGIKDNVDARLISWQCKKQTIVANSTTEAEYVAAANCCRQVLWIQNQILDYGFNFMNTKIHIDNESTICIVKNPVFHSKTKHIEIRHHFIRDSYEKKLIQVIKIHTDHNVADLLTKAFDMRLSIRSGKIEWKGLSHMLLVRSKAVTKTKQITATIDGKVKLVSEASIRRHLKLEDSYGITTLPNTEIFEQLTLMSNMRRASKEYTRVDIPVFPTMLVQGPILQGEGSTVPVESHHTPSGAPTTSQPPLSSPSRIPTRQETKVSQSSSPTYTNVADEAAFISVDVVHGGAATTVSSIDAGHGSGNIPKSPTMPHDSPLPGGHIPGSDKGNMTPHELTVLCTILSNKVDSLETELKQTKQTYGATLTKLIKKGRMIEDIDQDAGISLVTPTKVSSQEDQSEDQLGVLSAAKVLVDVAKKNVNTYIKRRRAVSTGSEEVSTASRIFSIAEESVSTVGASMLVGTASMVHQVNISIP